MVNTKIYQLKEIPAQDQIDYLLAECRIKEANEIFMLKGNKVVTQKRHKYGNGLFPSNARCQSNELYTIRTASLRSILWCIAEELKASEG